MKKLLLIICLLPVLAFGQFSGAKKLLLQQGEYCEYGNLNDYTTLLDLVYYYNSSDCSIPLTYITSLTTAKQALDILRSCTGASALGLKTGFCKSFSISNKVLDYYTEDQGEGYQYFPKCELAPISDYWGFDYMGNFPLGQVPILHIENGVITYIEYY